MKVLLTDMRHCSIEEEKKKILCPLGVKIETVFSESEEELIRNGRGAVAFLVSYARITSRVMESLPKLRVISKYGVGVDNIDTEAATRFGIYVTNVPDYCIEEVALHALSLILVGVRRICFYAQEIKRGYWPLNLQSREIPRLSEMNLGLFGFGRIARKLSLYMERVVNHIYFYDPYIKDYDNKYGKCSSVATLDELFRRSQIISIHVPLNSETERVVGERVLSKARGIVLINTSRAEIVERKAVLKFMDSGGVLFFGTDVFWQEPPDFNSRRQMEFLKRDNVLVTPHIGWYSTKSERIVRRYAAMEVARVLKGHKPKNLVNKDVLYRQRR